MFGQIATFLVDTVATFIVFLLLARFLLQWLRVPFRNPVGEFLVATTNWIVVPARRMVPAVARTDWATLLLAWILQALGIWLQASIVGAQPSASAILAVSTAAAQSDRPEVVVVCEKKAGSTTLRRLDKEQLETWLNKYTLGQLWRTGELGGNRW